jgi:hypothetical protein
MSSQEFERQERPGTGPKSGSAFDEDYEPAGEIWRSPAKLCILASAGRCSGKRAERRHANRLYRHYRVYEGKTRSNSFIWATL